jgi:ribosome modulation factor
MDTLTKPKAGSRRKVLTDETPKEVAGSNSVDADTVLVFLAKIQQEEAKVAGAKKRLNKAWKLALNAGIVRKDLELVRKFADQDPETVLSTLARIKQYAQWLDVPIGSQLSLFDVPTSSILSNAELGERAYRSGYLLGITGKNPDEDAYPMNHEHRTQHHEGWSAGQKVLLARIQPINIALDSDGKGDDADDDEMDEAA